ncbi:MAG: chromate transporter [Bacteroidaceae bacterium]|nr:chromate transporter [Bacteroidaceae bacterium]
MLLRLFLTFLKIGFFTIGGGYVMIPMIEREVVQKRHWLENDEFLDLMAIAQSAPGVFAINFSIFIGFRLKRYCGALICTLATALPSIVTILLIAVFFGQIKDNPNVEAVFKGIRPAVIALLTMPVINILRAAHLTWKTVWIPIVSTVLILCGISPMWVIFAAIVLSALSTVRQ